jgi:hypothetical protein
MESQLIFIYQTIMSSNTSNPTAASASQSAYQPPAWVFFLESQGLSLHGDPLIKGSDSAIVAWRKEILKPLQGMKLTGAMQKQKPLTADQVTALRTGKASKATEKKQDGWS